MVTGDFEKVESDDVYMEKINGIPMIPFGLLTGFCDGLEIRITELSEEGFSFRVPEKIEKMAYLEINFFDFAADCYRKVQLLEQERKVELTKETPFFFLYSVWTDKAEYKEQVNRLVKDYDNYISLKLMEEDAVLSEKMVGYPTEQDEIYADNFEQQKKEWFFGQENLAGKKESFFEPENLTEQKTKICRPVVLSEEKKPYATELPQFDLALTIDRPELYKQFLEKNWQDFVSDYWKNNFLENHPFRQKKVTQIYVGNEFCHNLFPNRNPLFQILEKAAGNNLAVTVAFTYIRDNLLEETEALLQELDLWCGSRAVNTAEQEKQQLPFPLEITVNDWAMLTLLKGKTHLQPVLGVLLNKRRKDVRYPYKQGCKNRVDSLAENNLNCGFYQNYLNNILNIKRFEFEACGYPVRIPEGKHSLHLPFFQTNTSQYCTLYAVCKNGNRGKQTFPQNCPKYCEEKVFLYPKHLKMIGRYNSLFGYDDKILWDEKQLKYYLEHGIDRVVVNML